jgi:Ferric reductase like transmembrane component
VATTNLIPLFILSGRNNPFIKWTNISFDTYNLLHRWIGRVVALEILVHVAAYTISKVEDSSWAAVWAGLSHTFIYGGFIVSHKYPSSNPIKANDGASLLLCFY